MKYDDARPQISTGDLIAVKGQRGFLAPFTRFFTSSDYTHAAVAKWVDGGLWMAELNGGKNHLVPVSQLNGEQFDVFKCPVGQPAVDDAISKELRVSIPYSLPAMVVIGILDWLGLNVYLHARNMLVCSSFCIQIYEAAGWPPHSHFLSPVDLTRLLEPKLQVTEW